MKNPNEPSQPREYPADVKLTGADSGAAHAVRDLVSVAERLRIVRQASRMFLDRWALANLMQSASPMARLVDEMEKGSDKPESNFHNRGRTWFFRGGVLDD